MSTKKNTTRPNSYTFETGDQIWHNNRGSHGTVVAKLGNMMYSVRFEGSDQSITCGGSYLSLRS